ncbi:MAG: AI-2E family transporter, partial [Candidatus Wildermuthbacteria bacterium]|nr:AI-2E family transporter [Candidatus Wildermuthbacteria bacterium]
MNEQRVLDISWGTIGKLALAGFALYAVFLIRDILAWTLFGVVIAVIFEPVVGSLKKLKIPRVVSAVCVYLAVFGLIAFVIYGMIPFFVSEIQRFSQLLPQYFETLAPFLKSVGFDIFTNVQTFVDGAVGGIENVGSSILNVLFSI